MYINTYLDRRYLIGSQVLPIRFYHSLMPLLVVETNILKKTSSCPSPLLPLAEGLECNYTTLHVVFKNGDLRNQFYNKDSFFVCDLMDVRNYFVVLFRSKRLV